MPIFVIPVIELRRDFVRQALGEDAKSSAFVPDSLFLRWISEAYRELNRRVKLLISRHTATLAASVSQTAPSDILDRLVMSDEALRIKDGSTGTWKPLTERDWPTVERLWPDLNNIEATTGPTDWTWDEREATPKLLLLPPPQVAVTNGLALDYVVDPGSLSRLYDDDTAAAAVTNGDATVTLPAAAENLFAVGDAFGVKVSADELPASWYKIANLTAFPDIELSETYQGTTDSTALFTLSQVSGVEYKRPGLVGFAPVEYALAKYWAREGDPAAEQAALVRWELEIGRIARQSIDRPGLVSIRQNVYRNHAALRR